MRVFINSVCDFLGGGGFIGFCVWLEKYFNCGICNKR